MNPRIDFQIHEFENEDKHFVIFQIDATRGRPCSFRGVPYIRIGSYKKPLDGHPERERKIWADRKEYSFKKDATSDPITADQVLALIDHSAFFEMLSIPLPDNKQGMIRRLEENKIIAPDGSKFLITNLGAILFAKRLEDFERLGRKTMRVIQYHGINRIKTKKEQTGIKGYAAGFQGLIKYIVDQLPSDEAIGTALRTEKHVYPSLAIRELVANALIHQDFDVSGTSPMVEIFDNRIEITNPGKPLIDSLRFIDHSPESRNELLARFMPPAECL